MKKQLSVLGFVLALAMTGSVYGGPCAEDHCSKVSATYNDTCIKDKKAGSSVYVPDPRNPSSLCYCGCSCFADNTLISANGTQMSVNDVMEGDSADSMAGKATVTVAFHAPAVGQKAVELRVEGGRQLVVSRNHPFILEGGIVTQASDLQVGSPLLDEAGKVIRVEAKSTRPYTGYFHNFILDARQSDGSDRILIANGVQNGDWKVQSFRDYANANLELRKIVANMGSH